MRLERKRLDVGLACNFVYILQVVLALPPVRVRPFSKRGRARRVDTIHASFAAKRHRV